MENNKHTPGQWGYTFNSNSISIHSDEMEFDIATINTSLKGYDNTEANAALIAAAPEMLKTLEAIKARINGEFDNPALLEFGELCDNESDDILGFCYHAITKATKD